MVCINYSGFHFRLLDNGYVATSLDKFEAVVYNGEVTVIFDSPEIIQLRWESGEQNGDLCEGTRKQPRTDVSGKPRTPSIYYLPQQR